MRWTRDQQKVINLRDRNILVSAAAGSGKTAVLVERIITMITDKENPVDIDRLVVVTFTNAAASEMRERISKALEKKILKEPDNVFLQKQMTLLHHAQITTIHSFCLNIIRNYFYTIDLDPGFRMGDDGEMKLLKGEVMEALMERCYEEASEVFLNLIETFATGKSDEALVEMIYRIYEYSMSYPWPVEWLSECKKMFDLESLEEMEKSVWLTRVMTSIRDLLTDMQEQNRQALQICELVDGPVMQIEVLEQDARILTDLLDAKSYSELSRRIQNIQFAALSRKRGADPKLRSLVKQLRDEVKSGINKIKELYFYQEPDCMLQDIKESKGAVTALIALTLDFLNAFTKAKRERELVDFHDLEHLALSILTRQEDTNRHIPTNVADELSEYYREILVDEYQDSNLVQETILNSISKERFGKPNLFMVGDVKQSIYRFRLARPELFMEKYNNYLVEDNPYQRIDLHKNFRSRAVVLDSVNYIFKQIMHRKLGGIQYNEEAALHVGSEYEETSLAVADSMEVLFVTAEDREESTKGDVKETIEDESGYSQREWEARAIAQRILELTDKQSGMYVLGEKGYHPVRYRDIVILLRTVTGWADVFAEVLMSFGIPAYSDTQSGYFSALEVQTVLNMLRIIDNPRQDIPLTAVLRSPFGGFKDEEIAVIRGSKKNCELYEALLYYTKEMPEQDKEDLQKKMEYFLYRLENYREQVPHRKVYELIQKLLDDTDYYNQVMSMPGGARRSANLDMLLQKAVEFDHASYKGLFRFIRYIDKMDKFEVDFGEASIGGENENAVRILSIHKSKGLEFPVVFAAGMGKTFNRMDSREALVIHSDYGIGSDCIDFNKRTKIPTLIKKAIQNFIGEENLGEELRVLYVALTRAKEKLILTGYVKRIWDALEKWSNRRLGYQNLVSAASYFDWIVPALSGHSKWELTNRIPLMNGCPQGREPAITFRVFTLKSSVHTEVSKQLKQKLNQEQLFSWDNTIIYDEELRDEIEKRRVYQYPYIEEQKLPVKMSVSDLKKKFMEEEGIKKVLPETEDTAKPLPRFLATEVQASHTAVGTVYHTVMQHIDLGAAGTKMDVDRELDRLVREHRITLEDRKQVSQNKIVTLCNSELGERMVKAAGQEKLHKEQPFVFGIPADEIFPESKSKEIILVQGIMDAYFEEEGKLVLIDYKTDHVNKGEENTLIRRYTLQLSLYQKALEHITQSRVKEVVIYSFALNDTIIL